MSNETVPADIRIIFLGPPGAGKGTQAQLLAVWLQIIHISTGEILRDAIAAATHLGQKAQHYVEAGELVPDELLAGLVRERVAMPDARGGWILDGYPRTEDQAKFLDRLLDELDQTCNFIINLDVPDTKLCERLLARGRRDDTPETVARRLQVYRDRTAGLIDFYCSRASFHTLDGNRSPKDVNEALKELVMRN
ncbi:adenylate kinase [Rubidibacter lacunae KORDI 51-2]|uniref:Adenylate kinase n=1 Tax=Rubidibacter lacunae KORDI 51-2 TaxID=582515 RepID=U5DNQ1_9CHRO|nr:adenylate kinase [Rubidibacter lacunae KORDI 51-2]